MVEINAELVKKLRDQTNVSMMECKKALLEANGDIAQATTLLRKRGIAIAANKATRTANQGVIAAATKDGGRTVALVEVNCETDFVAKNPVFGQFASELATQACDTDAPIADQVKDLVVRKVTETGENIVVKQNIRFVLSGAGAIASYIHLGGKVGAMVELACQKPETAATDGFKELIKDLTLHVAAASPRYLVSSEVPQDVIAAEREIYAIQVKDKPAQIVDKIVDGKIKKFYSEICLVDQIFVKDSKLSIAALLAAKGKELGDTFSIRRFARYQIGGK